jgi:hypothetical protein
MRTFKEAKQSKANQSKAKQNIWAAEDGSVGLNS